MQAEIIETIRRLKTDRKAVILAHNYQLAEIQDIADMTGDSLELSRRAAFTSAEVILFCGVSFMAETAAILNPGKIVLLPRLDVGCPMADMITADDVRLIKADHPDVPIVTYVNSTAAVKAESTVCCTSANSISVVESFRDASRIYMAPDQNLAQYTARHVGKEILYWHGYCPYHHNLTVQEVLVAKQTDPDALFLAHPECRPEVLALADHVQSTSGMLRYVADSSHRAFIVGTEVGILHPMRKANPDKQFYPASDRMFCTSMKRITLEDVRRSLETLEPRVSVEEETRLKALVAVERMLAVSQAP
jgi:quinolinate synthase